MSFKGDLSTIGLAEVFQMISMSQKEGTLIVQDSDSRKSIYFGPTGVRLISTGKRKGMRLGDILLRTGKINESVLSEALETSKIQKKMLGEVLVENGIVTDQDIQQLVREQIEEEIYDLFLWKKANFEFVEGPPTEGLRDPDAPVTKLSFDVNGLLLEAVRRADEWSIINQKIPALDCIFVFVSESDRLEEDKTAPDSLRRVYRFLDGQTSVADIVENTGIPKFEVCKSLIELIDRGRVRLLTVQETLDLAAHRMAEGNRDKALRMYLAAAAQAPADPKVTAGVARTFESQGMNKEAASYHVKSGRLFMEQGDLDRALDHMQQAVALRPDDAEMKMGMFELHATAGNLEEGKKVARDLVAQALMTTDYPRARSLCDRILSADPADLQFRAYRAKVLHRTNQKRDLEEDLAYLGKHMPADPREADKLQRDLREVMTKAPSTAHAPPASARPARGRRRKIVIAVVGLLLAALLGAGLKFELDARHELDLRIDESRKLLDEQSFAKARLLIEDFLKGTYRFSLTTNGKATRYLLELDDRQKNWQAEKAAREKRQEQETLEKLQADLAAVQRERLQSAEAALEKARRLRDFAQSKQSAEYVRQAQEIVGQLEKHISEALQLKVEAEKMLEKGKEEFARAAAGIEKLLSEYPTTGAARDAKYPLAITTRPAGVKVTETRSGAVVGVTGAQHLEFRMGQGQIVDFSFEKPGYKSVRQLVPNKRIGWLDVPLKEKLPLWVWPLGSTVTGDPLLVGDTVYVAGSNRGLYAIQVVPRNRLDWFETLESGIVGSPRFADGVLCVGTAGKGLFGIAPKAADKRAWRFAPEERITGTPGVSSDGKVVYVGTPDRTLYAIQARTGKPMWKRDLPGETRVEPVAAAGTLVVACENGVLMGLQEQTGDELWKLQCEPGFSPMCLAEGTIYVATSDQRLHAVDPSRGQRVWPPCVLPSPVLGRPARAGSTVFAGSDRAGNVHFVNAGTGQRLGMFPTGGAVGGGIVAAGPLVLFGSDDQFFYALDGESRALLWQLPCPKRVRWACVVGEGRAYFVCEDSLYAVELN